MMKVCIIKCHVCNKSFPALHGQEIARINKHYDTNHDGTIITSKEWRQPQIPGTYKDIEIEDEDIPEDVYLEKGS